MSIIIFIIILGLLIFVHELGHFLVAKKSGIRVDEFAVGFPPRIFSKVKNGTRYALNAIPFGGYVKIFGENPDEESLSKGAEDSFVNKSKLTQASVLIAGVLFNVIFAWVLFTAAFMIGFDVPKDTFSFVENENFKTQIIGVEENSPAERAGLVSGDVLKSIQKDEQIFEPEDSQNAISLIKELEAPFVVKVLEDGTETVKEVSISSKLEINGEKLVGLYLDDVVSTRQLNPLIATWNGFLMTGYSIKEISIALFNLIVDSFKGDADLKNVAGPVGIVGLVGDAAKAGVVNLIIFTAFISINLAILNLLPFPALDGGRLLFILIEVVTRKNINYKLANILNFVGFAILILLMVLITVSDIGKLF